MAAYHLIWDILQELKTVPLQGAFKTYTIPNIVLDQNGHTLFMTLDVK
jgi:hypothetical protein